MEDLPEGDRDRVRAALLPYSPAPHRYAAFAVIDAGTYSDEEAQVLRTRRNEKQFEVDVVCLESFSDVSKGVYAALKPMWSGSSV
jgi:hypothetical protein